ncbi:MAG: ATP-binding protein [Flavobacteriaceae bacterium]|nr:ATP-binding protein [Flavobacteriaceae bacterium]
MEETLRQTDSNCLRIVLFGPESSGETTLAKQLAAHFDTQWVPEFMRDFLQKKWDDTKETIEKKDLTPIAEGQINSENRSLKLAQNFLFCDTNLLELKVYSEYYYDGYCPKEILKACDENMYDHYFLTQVDTPWEADDLRDRPYEREKLFRIFEKELQQRKLPYTLLEGDQKDRLQRAIQLLSKLKKD